MLDLAFTFCGMGVFGVSLSNHSCTDHFLVVRRTLSTGITHSLHIHLFQFHFNRSLFQKAI